MLHTKNLFPRLPRTKLRSSSIWKKLRSSSIKQNIEVIFHNSSSWVKIRLHTENQLPGSPGSALKVCVVGWWGGGGFHSIMWSPQLRLGLELGCDNFMGIQYTILLDNLLMTDHFKRQEQTDQKHET
jgi:hypothetical protein